MSSAQPADCRPSRGSLSALHNLDAARILSPGWEKRGRMAYALPLEREDRLIGKSLQTADGEAFDLLYRRYAGAVREFCRVRLGSSAEAEDACHEALIKAHRALPRFRNGARVWPWLATIADHVCTDFKRSRSRHVSLEENQASEVDCPEEQVARGIREEILREALQTLPSHYRTYIRLCDLEGWSYDEIASFFGTSISAVKSTLLRARRALRQTVEEVAQRRHTWPLPVVIPTVWGSLRRAVRQVRRLLVESGARAETLSNWGPALANAFLAVAILVATGTNAGVGHLQGGESGTGPPVVDSVTVESTLGKDAGPPQVHGTEGQGVEVQQRRVAGTPRVSVSNDANENGQEESVLIPSVVIDCAPSEEQGPIMGAICPVIAPGPGSQR